MYGRAINFTLLAPSLWSVVEAVAQPVETEELKRNLFKSSDNTGFIIVSELESQDIDNETDWKLAELKFQLK